MGAKHSAVPSVFSLQYVLLLFIEKHLHEGGTAGGMGGEQRGLPSPSFVVNCLSYLHPTSPVYAW